MSYSIDKVLDFITRYQEADGSFPTYELYPVARPGEDWSKLADSSPFITSCVLASLIHARDAGISSSFERAKVYLLSQMELGAYWRFWPLRSKQHPVPLDVDVTALCSVILVSTGVSLPNKNFLIRNRDGNGGAYTWIIPTFRNIVRQPVLSFQILRTCIQALPTYRLKYFYYTDQEPAVAANLLLYLGEEERTFPLIDRVIREIEKGNFPMEYYHDELSVYYHIARAFASGVKRFNCLSAIIVTRVMERLNGTGRLNELQKVMAANILLDFHAEADMAERLVESVAAGDMYPAQWKSLPYFSSKDRNFFAGSPQFTAAVFAEAAIKLNNRN